MAIKRFNGSSFIDAQTYKRFNGASWQDVTIAKRWNGSSWVDLLPSQPTPPTPTEYTYTYTFPASTAIWTYLVNTQQKAHLHEPIQGCYEQNVSSTMRKSILIIPSAARTTLSGATIKSVRISLGRLSDAHGTSSGATIGIKTRSLDTHPTTFTSGTMADAYAQNVTLTRGQRKWVTLYNSVGNGIRDGSVKSLVLQTSKTGWSGYIKYNSSITLEVKYTK